VRASAGQFGCAAQGIFAYRINAWLQGHSLKYIDFEGTSVGCVTACIQSIRPRCFGEKSLNRRALWHVFRMLLATQ
jgi:hypothetical protein